MSYVYITEDNIFGEYFYKIVDPDGKVIDKFFSKTALTEDEQYEVAENYRVALDPDYVSLIDYLV